MLAAWLLLTAALYVPSQSWADDDQQATPRASISILSQIIVGQSVVLDGASSINPSGTPLAYAWRVVSAPSGATAKFDDPTNVRPKLNIDVSGDYVVELDVSARKKSSDGDNRDAGQGDDNRPQFAYQRLTLSTANQAPVAKPQAIRSSGSATVFLDGARSFDLNGDGLAYAWSLTAAPPRSTAAIAAPTSARTTFAPDKPGGYTAQLVVTDSRGRVSDPRTVTFVAGQSQPTADAGRDRSALVGSTVWLDPFASTDFDGNRLTSSWALLSKPAGSTVRLSMPVLGRIALKPDVAGSYVVQLAVNDGTSTSYDTVVVAAGQTVSTAPLAVAGADQRVAAGATVALDGSASTDLEGDTLTYVWALLSKPVASVAAIDDATSPRPTFVADQPGSYIAQLRTQDQTGLIAFSTVVITTLDATAVPTANAGRDSLASAQRTATLDGTLSASPNGLPLLYSWSMLGLDTAQVAQSADIATPTAASTPVTLSSGRMKLSRAVLLGPVAVPMSDSDNDGGNSGLRLSSVGRLNAADGSPRTIWRIDNASSQVRSVQLASVGGAVTSAHTLQPKTRLYVASTFTSGTARHMVSEGSVQRDAKDCRSQSTEFDDDDEDVGKGDPTSFAVFQLLANDGGEPAASTVLVTTGNVAPVASPGAEQAVIPGTSVTLDGTGSSDANGTQFTYAWSLLYKPASSTATLGNASSSKATLTPDKRGLYVAQLIVSDGVLISRPVTVVIRGLNRPPVIASQPLLNATAGLSYSYQVQATDPDNDPITYALTTPADGSMRINASTGLVSWQPTTAGSYGVTLVAKDDHAGVTAQSFTIAVVASGPQPPILAAIPNQTVVLGQTLAFKVSATDPNGLAVTYSASPLPLPTGARFDSATGNFLFTPASPTPASYNLVFGASNGALRAQQPVTITVQSGNQAAPATVTGRVLDAVQLARGVTGPIAGVTVSLGTQTATTVADGSFSLANVTPGSVTISAAKTGYTSAARSVTIYGGSTNTLTPDLNLVQVTGTGTQINPAGATTVSSAGTPGVTVTVPQGVAQNPDGTPFTGTLTVVDVPPAAAGLPDTIQSCSVQALSASAPVAFASSLPITLPNRDNLPGGSTVIIWAYDASLAKFIRSGQGVVSADGTQVTTAVGGLQTATAFLITPTPLKSVASAAQPLDKVVPSVLGEGNLQTRYGLPSYSSLGKQRAMSFTYNSTAADPRPVLTNTVTIRTSNVVPSQIETQLFVGGIKQPGTAVTSMTRSLKPGDTLPVTGQFKQISQTLAFDASALPAGNDSYRMLTFARYACSAVAVEQRGAVSVPNRKASPFGAGWKPSEIQKLIKNPDGSVTIEEPDGTLDTFRSTKGGTFPGGPNVSINGLGFTYVWGDIFQDGKLSLVLAEYGTGNILIYRNMGNRQLQLFSTTHVSDPAVAINDGTQIVYSANQLTGLALGDFNGDGILDIVYVKGGASEIGILNGVGGGKFATPKTIPFSVAHSGASGVKVADFDGSGRDSIAVLTSDFVVNGVLLYLSRGDGTFDQNQVVDKQIGINSIAVGDFNGDGIADIAMPVQELASVQVIYGSRAHSFTTQAVRIDGQIPFLLVEPSIAAGDLDTLGRDSIAVATDRTVSVVKAIFTPSTTPPLSPSLTVAATYPIAVPTRFSTVSIADVFGTGSKQVAIGTASTNIQVWSPFKLLNGGSQVTIATSGIVDGTDFVDLDGDGIPDALVYYGVTTLGQPNTLGIGFGQGSLPAKFARPFGDFSDLVQNADGTYTRTYPDGTLITFTAAGYMASVRDTNGNTTNYAYDAVGVVQTVTDATGQTTKFTYANGLLTSTTDPAGRVTTAAYDSLGNLIKVTQPDATSMGYTYDAQGHITSQTDQRGNTTTATYGAAGRLTSVTMPNGASVSLQVAQTLGLSDISTLNPPATAFVLPSERLTQLVDARGNPIVLEVNQWGAPVRSLDALGRVMRYTRDANNLATQVEKASSVVPPAPLGSSPLLSPLLGGSILQFGAVGAAPITGTVTNPVPPNPIPDTTGYGFQVTQMDYDLKGNVVALREAVGTPLQRQTLFEYEPLYSRLTKKTEPQIDTITAGAILTWAYDANGNLTTATDGLGFTKTYTYDARGLMASMTDERSNTTTYAYDALGRQISQTDVLGHVFTSVLDARGNTLLQINAQALPEEQRISYTFDPLNRMLTLQDGVGNITAYGYDAAGNQTAIADPTGVTLTRAYDTLNRVARETDPATGTTTYAYDASSNLASVTDPLGQVTTFTYDAVNRLASSTDAIGATRFKTYDLADNVTTGGDALGNTTSYTFDVLNHLLTRTDPTSHVWSWAYDPRDLAIRITKPSGATIAMGYDLRRLPIQVGVPFDTLRQRTYTYDAAQNLITANFTAFEPGPYVGFENRSFAYDTLNRLARTDWTSTASGFGTGHFVAYTYDALSRRTAVNDNWNATTAFAYDRADRLTAITAPSGKVTTLTFDPGNRPTKVKYPSGLESRLSYDIGAGTAQTGRLASIARGLTSTGAGGSALNQLLGTTTYGYDARGDITSQSEPARARSFTYDPVQRLTAVAQSPPTPAVNVEAYTLDLEGNRISSKSSAFYVTAPANRVIEDANAIYTYDVDGNQVTKTIKATGQQWRYTYDVYDRLLQAATYASAGASTPDRIITYAYDALDRRIQRSDATASASSPTAVETYIHDGWNTNAIEERTINFGSTIARRTWYTQAGTDDLVALTTWDQASGGPAAAGSAYYSTDHLGSVRALHDDTGTVVASYDHDTFGNPQTAVESTPQPFRFTGRDYDRVTGLYHYRTREYDPQAGRFLQEDQIWFNSGDFNVYRYVGSRPVRYSDPNGRNSTEYGLLSKDNQQKAAFYGGVGAAIACTLGVVGDALAWANIEQTGQLAVVLCSVAGGGRPKGGAGGAPPQKGGGGPNKGGGAGAGGAGGASGAGGSSAGGSSTSGSGPFGPAPPDFITSPGGTTYPIPSGSSGPTPVRTNRGIQYTGGSGGNGLSDKVTDFRFMDPRTQGKYLYPDGYGVYSNGYQTVDPLTGKTVSPWDPWAHIPGGPSAK